MKFTKEEAYDKCGIRIRPHKSPIAPTTCKDCYYFSSRCEIGRTDGLKCVRFRIDWKYTNRVRSAIQNDYEWCKNHLHSFCEVDKDLFFAIWGERYEEEMLQ